MYKQIKNANSVLRLNGDDTFTSIPFAKDNTDYANFKKDVSSGAAQLQDADGNLMPAQAVKQFVATLP